MSHVRKSLVTAIVPCYKCIGTIRRALDSVIKQTEIPAEVILVDDSSGDGTLDVLYEIERQYAGWVRVISLNKNVGAASARNAGWNLASQPYIAFLDADDAWHPRKIELQLAYMEANPDVILSGHGYRLLAQNVLPDWNVIQEAAKPIGKWALILSNKFVTPSVMIRRDIEHRFVERQRYMEDHMLWLKIICSGGCVVKLPTELAAIYKEPFGVTGLSSQVWLMERGDLGNCRRLYHGRYINTLQFLALGFYSILKYVRRLIIYGGYLRWKK